MRRVKAEVRDALKKGRKIPRRRDGGLPSLEVRVSFELRLEEHDLLEKALRKVSDEIGESSSKKRVEPKDALLFMARRMLETAPESPPKGRTEKEGSIYTVLYHQCQSCGKSSLPTADGPVEIDREVVERVARDARKVTISPEEESAKEESSPPRDHPNPQSLTRRVALRDGRVCSNPFCRRKLGLQAHHIEFRSKGGKNALSNETLVCARGHALLHKKLLSVSFQNEANPREGLCWRARGDEIQSSFEEDLKILSTLGVGDIDWSSEPCGEDVFSTRVESNAAWATSPLVRGLRDLRYRKAEAPLRVNMAERLKQADERLRSRLGRAPSEEELLREGLRPSG